MGTVCSVDLATGRLLDPLCCALTVRHRVVEEHDGQARLHIDVVTDPPDALVGLEPGVRYEAVFSRVRER